MAGENPSTMQRLRRGHLRRLQHFVEGGAREAPAQARDAQLVEDAAGSCAQAARGVERVPQWVGEAGERAAMTDQRSGVEGPQAQTLVVEHAARFGVSGQQHLKATVEQEAVRLVGAQAPARGVASLEHLDVHVVVRELAGAAQPGQSGADDDDVAHAPSPSSAVGSSGVVAPGARRSQ